MRMQLRVYEQLGLILIDYNGHIVIFIGFVILRFALLFFSRNLIIDEADRLLDMGFEPQLRKVIQSCKYGMPTGESRQTALFSATFPPSVALLAHDFLRGARCISLNIVHGRDEGDTELLVPVWGQAVTRSRYSNEFVFTRLKATVPREIVQEVQWVTEGHDERKFPNAMLERLIDVLKSAIFGKERLHTHPNATALDYDRPFHPWQCLFLDGGVNTNLQSSVESKNRVLVFCNTKREVELVDKHLIRQGFKSVSIHGDRSQDQRNHSVSLFRSGKAPILVATSVRYSVLSLISWCSSTLRHSAHLQ